MKFLIFSPLPLTFWDKSLQNQGTHRVRTFFKKQISRTFPGLFQNSDWFFKGFKIHINPYTPKISMLILLTAFHTPHVFWLSLTDFQNFPGPVAFFQDFLVLENARIKFQDFPGFSGPVRTLYTSCRIRSNKYFSQKVNTIRDKTDFLVLHQYFWTKVLVQNSTSNISVSPCM